MTRTSKQLAAPHPARLPEKKLLEQCDVTFGRSAGPGGQHRNKVETAVLVVHRPTGIEAAAGERRRQVENRRMAVRRLRLKLAVGVRTAVDPKAYRPSELWEGRRQGRQMSINPKHADYPALLAEALDLVIARRFDVAGAAGVLGLSMSQLAKLIRHDKRAFALVNDGREQRGLPPLK
jgi:hypothetical protein